MNAKQSALAISAAALLLSGNVLGDSFAGADGSTTVSSSGTAPYVEIVVYDGTTLPATVIAGCSAPDCMGASGAAQTGTVTHPKDYVGWMVANGDPKTAVYLYVDGKSVAAVRSNKLLVWNAGSSGAGPHNVQAMAYASDGTAGWSAPLTITVVK